jgi:F0F1-type ATP synthase assembly protein I
MIRFLVSTLVLLVVPMSLLNPMGRPAFLGYYLGIATMWFVVMMVGQAKAKASSAAPPRG